MPKCSISQILVGSVLLLCQSCQEEEPSAHGEDEGQNPTTDYEMEHLAYLGRRRKVLSIIEEKCSAVKARSVSSPGGYRCQVVGSPMLAGSANVQGRAVCPPL